MEEEEEGRRTKTAITQMFKVTRETGKTNICLGDLQKHQTKGTLHN